MGKTTLTTSPDGRRVAVPDENLDLAKSKGYKVITEASNHPIQAALEGAARGLTSGLSDNNRATDDESRKARLNLQEQNPVASKVGEFAGVVGQSVALPELGVAKLGTVGRIAAEGTLAGIGPQISEAALTNKPINTEILAADALASIAVNGITHGAINLGGRIATNVAGKAGELAASDAVKTAAESLQEKLMKKTLGIEGDTYKFAKANGLLSAVDHQGVAELSNEAARINGGKAIEQWDDILKAAPDLAPLKEKWIELGQTPGAVARKNMLAIEKEVAVSMKNLSKAAPLEDTVAKPVYQYGSGEAHVPSGTAVDEVTNTGKLFTRVPEPRPGFKGEQIKGDAAGTANQRVGAVVSDASSDTAVAAKKQFDEMLAKGRQGRAAESAALEDTHVRPAPRDVKISPITQGVPQQRVPGTYPPYAKEVIPGGGAKPVMQDLNVLAKNLSTHSEDWAKAKEVYNAATGAAGRHADMGIVNGHVLHSAGAAAMYGNIHGAGAVFAASAVKNTARKFASNRGGYLVNSALEKLSAGEVLPKVFKAFQTQVEQMIATAPGVLGPFASVLGHAAAQGTDAFMAVHTNLANSENGGDYLARLGLQHETPEEVAAYGQKLAMLEAVEKRRTQFNTAVDKHTNAFFKGDSFGHEEPAPAVTKKSYQGHFDGLQHLLRDPHSLTAHMPGDVITGAPGLAAGTGTYAMAAAQFLMDRAPKAPDAWKPKALQAPFEPSAADMVKWNRYIHAVGNPQAMAAQMAGGKSTPETVEAVRTLYPNLFAAVQQRVMTQLTALNKPLAYDKKIVLANIFGQQILGVSTQSQMYLQSVHQAAAQQGGPPGAAPGGQAPSSNDGRQMVNSNKNLQTQTQRLEGR